MAEVSVTNFRNNIFEYLRSVIRFNDILNISTKDGNAVVMSKEDYDAMLETFYVMSTPGMMDKIREAESGEFIPLSEFLSMAEDDECTM